MLHIQSTALIVLLCTALQVMAAPSSNVASVGGSSLPSPSKGIPEATILIRKGNLRTRQLQRAPPEDGDNDGGDEEVVPPSDSGSGAFPIDGSGPGTTTPACDGGEFERTSVCGPVTTQLCEMVPRQVCRNVPRQQCTNVPRQECRMECRPQNDNNDNNNPGGDGGRGAPPPPPNFNCEQVCETVNEQVCNTVNEQVCEMIEEEQCTTITRTVCNEVLQCVCPDGMTLNVDTCELDRNNGMEDDNRDNNLPPRPVIPRRTNFGG